MSLLLALERKKESDPVNMLALEPFELTYYMDRIRFPIQEEEYIELIYVTTNHINSVFEVNEVDPLISSNTTFLDEQSISHELKAIKILYETTVKIPLRSDFWASDFNEILIQAFGEDWIGFYKLRLSSLTDNLFANTTSISFSTLEGLRKKAQEEEKEDSSMDEDGAEVDSVKISNENSSNTDPTLYIAIAIGSIVVVVLASMLAIFLWQLRQRRQLAAEDEKADETGSDMSHRGDDSDSGQESQEMDDQISSLDMESYSVEARQVSRLDL